MAMQKGVVFFLWVLVLVRTAVIQNKSYQERCQDIELISRKLQFENRVMYMHDNFPIDYQLPVKYEEILQCQNITSLVNEGITMNELRFLWGIVSENVLLSIWHVLPQRHPSRSYIEDLKSAFKMLHDDNELELSDIIKDIPSRLWTPGDRVKSVAPKDLLDDCLKVLDVLFQEECDLCLPTVALEGALCPNGTVPGFSATQRRSC